MSQAFKRAVFSSVLLLLLAVPVFGLRLQTEEVSLIVQQAEAPVWWTIGGATVVQQQRVGVCAIGSPVPMCSVASCMG